jgi:hypothetical protein
LWLYLSSASNISNQRYISPCESFISSWRSGLTSIGFSSYSCHVLSKYLSSRSILYILLENLSFKSS